MKKIIFLAGVLVLGAVGYLAFFSLPNQKLPPPSSSPTPVEDNINYTASFTIITGSITRSFKDPKYHSKSPDVYIENPDPGVVNVKKAGITWDDFFKTLPMKLTKDCLTTGDEETLCNGKNGSLKFFLNNIEDKDLLDKEIKQNDQILVKFTSIFITG